MTGWTNRALLAKMKLVKAAICLLAIVVLAGCGKGTGIMGGNPYGGVWRGKYEDSQGPQGDGTVQIQVDAIGNLKGQGQHNGTYTDFEFTGSVDKFGKFEGVITGTYAGPWSGTLMIDKDGSLRGKLTQPNSPKFPNYIELKRPSD